MGVMTFRIEMLGPFLADGQSLATGVSWDTGLAGEAHGELDAGRGIAVYRWANLHVSLFAKASRHGLLLCCRRKIFETILVKCQWMGGRVVEGGSLENYCTLAGTPGSNPGPSASLGSKRP